MPVRIIFFGTAELACESLRALARSPELQVTAVVTQPDKPCGRDLQLQPSHVKKAAIELGLPVLQPKRARETAFIQQLREFQPDLMVVVAYGQILPQELLDVPKFGCLNVHTSLLPKHRGAAPIQWAILSGDSETGVTIMKMDAGLDTGPMVAVEKTKITENDNSQSLHDRLAKMGAELLVRTIPDYVNGTITPQAQPEGGTYARKISKEDGLIDWGAPSGTIWNRIRAFTPWPGAFTFLKAGEKMKMIKIWEAKPLTRSETLKPGTIIESGKEGVTVSTGEGALQVMSLQLEARKRMSAQEFLAGHPLPAGTEFVQAK
jgi:methionyl-tRNA formyltransferase